jgi:cytoskeletal protein CcmA (bactofilin family)
MTLPAIRANPPKPDTRTVAALFRKTTTESPPPVPGQDIGLLGLDTGFKGAVHFRGTLTVDGSVMGDVTSPEGSGATLVVNQNATVTGDIVADSVLISGKVTGNIKAKERVEIFSAGRVKGDVHTGDIMIEGGAEFQGFCHMLREQPKPRGTAADGDAKHSGNGATEAPAPAEEGKKSRAAAR